MKQKKWFLVIFIILGLLVSCSSNKETNSANNIQDNYGNLISNLYNNGTMVQSDNYIFFLGFENGKYYIFKSSFDGSVQEKLLEGSCSYLNMNGDLLYFFDDKKNNISLLNTINYEKKVVYNGKVLGFLLYEDQIFYCDMIDSCLYSIDINGGNKYKICNDIVNPHSIYIYKEYIYYATITNNDNQGFVYRIDLNGENKKIIM